LNFSAAIADQTLGEGFAFAIVFPHQRLNTLDTVVDTRDAELVVFDPK